MLVFGEVITVARASDGFGEREGERITEMYDGCDFTDISSSCTPILGKNIGSMYGIFSYIWLIFMVNVGKYTIHGSYETMEQQNPIFDECVFQASF